MEKIIDFINVRREQYVEEMKALLAIPSISALPVTRLDAGLARNTTAPIISSICPTRPSAILLITDCLNSGSSNMPLVSAVSMKVGQRVLTRMFCCPSSQASALVMPSTACLLAQYTVRRGAPT